ncbi:hypothetical protein ACVWW2_005193 [Bradyrhizobium sp. LM4.3]
MVVEEGLYVRDLRLDGLAQHRSLIGNGSAAEIADTREHYGQRGADDREPDRMGQVNAPPKRVGQRVEANAEQHAGEDQEQGGGKIPAEHQHCREQHDADAPDRDRPGQIVAGPGPFISGNGHIGSFSRAAGGALFRQTRFRSRPRQRAGLTLPRERRRAMRKEQVGDA